MKRKEEQKNKEEIRKKMKELIMGEEIVNEKYWKKEAKSGKSSEEAVAGNNMEKVIKSNKCNILWLAY